MNTISNGTTTMGRTFFRYLRPAVNGLGETDEPDANIAQAIKKLVAILGMGFVDRNDPAGEASLKRLEEKLKRLENEDENGTRAANSALLYAIRAVGDAKIKLNNAESDLQRRTAEQVRAQEILNALIKEQQAGGNDAPEIKRGVDAKAAQDDVGTRIKRAAADLKAKQDAEAKAKEVALQCKNILAACETGEESSRAEVSRIKNEVKSDVEETIRDIDEFTAVVQGNMDYRKLLALQVLAQESGQRTKFKMKIGKDSSLHTRFIMVEEKIGKAVLSFNARLFFRYDVVKEYLFLRACLIDGLQDKDAIFDRMVDDQDGGIKYLYDFVVEDAITKIIKAKKLNDD